ncbi:phosphoglycerate dehydrogenase [Amycolatopsis sp. NPDC049868]|uniref:phosphoglycerate dehydrogenase n=1 Tax=Amycolatopsis sp. NPDC049868 TaxID=3363934 RepID=UPI0037B244DF
MSSDLIAISTSSFGTQGERVLTGSGLQVRRNTLGRKPDGHELRVLLRGARALIAGTEQLDRAMLEECDELRLISRCGVGVDNVDLDAAQSLGIKVVTAAGGVYRSAAELTVSLMLAVARRVCEADRKMRDGDWTKLMGRGLVGAAVGLIGCGNVGKAVIQLLSGFGVAVKIYDPVPPEPAFLASSNAAMASKAELLRTCDVITVHAAATTTQPVLGRQDFEMAKPGAIIINTARGHLVDHDGLFDALTTGRVAGAGLDVHVAEPYDGPLSKLDNVVLTPHMGSYEQSSRTAMEVEAAQNVVDAWATLGGTP